MGTPAARPISQARPEYQLERLQLAGIDAVGRPDEQADSVPLELEVGGEELVNGPAMEALRAGLSRSSSRRRSFWSSAG